MVGAEHALVKKCIFGAVVRNSLTRLSNLCMFAILYVHDITYMFITTPDFMKRSFCGRSQSYIVQTAVEQLWKTIALNAGQWGTTCGTMTKQRGQHWTQTIHIRRRQNEHCIKKNQRSSYFARLKSFMLKHLYVLKALQVKK